MKSKLPMLSVAHPGHLFPVQLLAFHPSMSVQLLCQRKKYTRSKLKKVLKILKWNPGSFDGENLLRE